MGYSAIVYLAAITNIDPGIYEACEIDGANRLQRIWYMTLPSIVPTIILMSALSLGNILNAGFDQVYTMYSPLVYSSSTRMCTASVWRTCSSRCLPLSA